MYLEQSRLINSLSSSSFLSEHAFLSITVHSFVDNYLSNWNYSNEHDLTWKLSDAKIPIVWLNILKIPS